VLSSVDANEMRPRRGKGANRRGSQSIDRVRYVCKSPPGSAHATESRSKDLHAGSRQGRLGRWSFGVPGCECEWVDGRLAASMAHGLELACMTGQGHFGLARLPVRCPGGRCDGSYVEASQYLGPR
jgi:hypothetical protein